MNKEIKRIETFRKELLINQKNRKSDLIQTANELYDFFQFDMVKKLKDIKDVSNLSYSLENVSDRIKLLLDELTIITMREKDEYFDIEELEKEYYKREINKKFPKLNWEKYKELLKNPIRKVQNPDGKSIKFHIYWIRKMMFAINQMIFDEMDIVALNIGKEGSGKSCWSSQQVLWFYLTLKEIGLVDYENNIDDIFYVDLITFSENRKKQKEKDYFRLEVLDEGNELGRLDYQKDTNKNFKYEMRTERKQLRITFVNIQQIGEIDPSITLSRANFIYDCNMSSNTKLGLLHKGTVDMYILPRDNKIYSEKYKKVLYKKDIINDLARLLLKKTDYYIGLPKEYICKTFTFKNIWGYNKEEYDSVIKEKLKNKKFKSEMKLGDKTVFVLYEFLQAVSLGTIFKKKIKKEKAKYDVIDNLISKISKYYAKNKELYEYIKANYDKYDKK